MNLKDMKVRKGKIDDFKKLLWSWKGNLNLQKKYIKKINLKEQEFWVIEYQGKIIGEFHIFWKDQDENKADGKRRAYLSTFRIYPKFQKQGLGTKLRNKVFRRIKEKKFVEATIGSYIKDKKIQKLYQKWGFNKKIKEDIDDSIKPPQKFILYLKKLK